MDADNVKMVIQYYRKYHSLLAENEMIQLRAISPDEYEQYKKRDDFVGYIALKDLREEIWEIAIELLRTYRNQGYGYNAMTIFLDAFSKLTGEYSYVLKMDADNYPSQALADKIGAIPNGTSEYMLCGELLGLVLNYKIDWKCM